MGKYDKKQAAQAQNKLVLIEPRGSGHKCKVKPGEHSQVFSEKRKRDGKKRERERRDLGVTQV